MNDDARHALLPTGLRDILPPDAAFEAATVERLLAIVAAHGYQHVNPPLVEFEDSLLAGAGAAMATDTFRLMDPVSQHMMAVRADMTVQIARIATTRLIGDPRPLRLAYAGPVLRVKGSQLRPEREFRQVGYELIGTQAPAADAEVIRLAVEALQALGIGRLTVDLNLPTLVPAVCASLGFAGEALDTLKAALNRKDRATIAEIAGDRIGLLAALLDAGGPAEAALARLERLDLPAETVLAHRHLAEAVALVRAELPDLHLTLDAVEHRGFEYHTGAAFSLFAAGVRGELGRGGRYLAGNGGAPEPATGVTLYMDMVLQAAVPPPPPPRVYLPWGTDPARRREVQGTGRVTVAALEPLSPASAPESAGAEPLRAEARRLACSHILLDGRVEPLEG